MSESLTAFELLWQIDQRCRLLAADLPSQPARQDRWSGIGFRLGEHWYVTPMGEVSEVLPELRVTQLPGVKPWVKGVANLRGRLLLLRWRQRRAGHGDQQHDRDSAQQRSHG